MRDPEISIVIPVYNEEENVEPVYQELREVMQKIPRTWEVLFIDDGSTDTTWKKIQKLVQEDPHHVVGIRLARNFGQTSAMYAGFQMARGTIIITMDGDGQNDPGEIPRLLQKIEEGYDVVSGWRKNRQDPFLTRILPSRIANTLISWVTGVHLRDYGCTLKAYRGKIVRRVRLYGEMHRFLPALCWMEGATVTEIPVNHRPRTRGKSKYGLWRIFKVLLDLLTVKFMLAYFQKPIYFYGSAGFLSFLVGGLFVVWTIYDKLVLKVYVHRNPKLLISFLFVLVGIQLILMGLLMEVMIRSYYESQDRKPYIIREVVGREVGREKENQ